MATLSGATFQDAQLEFSQSPCWTCRRARVKCDGRRPMCFKCQKKGRECLGYSARRPVVWIGLASRGKMVGRTIPVATEAEKTPTVRNQAKHLSRALTDPAWQDLSARYREHIWYYLSRCIPELTLEEARSGTSRLYSAYREGMMSMTPASPVLMHSVIAISALHQASARALSARPRGSGSGSPDADTGPRVGTPRHQLVPGSDGPDSTQHSEGLRHTALAIEALRQALDRNDASDSVLAAVFHLGWVGFVDPESDVWGTHLHGLKGLLSERRCGSHSSPLLQFFKGVFMVLSIFASTFNPVRRSLLESFSAIEIDVVLQDYQTCTWTGCPAELLRLLHTVGTLASFKPGQMPQGLDVAAIFHNLDHFDPHEWIKRCRLPGSRAKRLAIAQLFKGAIEVYARRVFGGQFAAYRDVSADLIEDLFALEEHIGCRDSYSKGMFWPAFIVGAEARSERHRRITQDFFEALREAMPLSAVGHALRVLRTLWARSLLYRPGSSWVHDIRQSERGLLPV